MSFSLILVIVLFLVFLFLRVPVWASMTTACISYLLINKIPLVSITTMMAGGGITSYVLLAFPLYSLAGNLMNRGSVGKRIFDFSTVNVGWIRGGLGHVNVLASMLFAGMSGTAIADISGLGAIEIKQMTDHGYDSEFSVGITIASSVVGPIIPPSTAAIVYCVIANQSVVDLFIGGFLPGLLIGLSLMVGIYIVSGKKNYEVTKRPTIIQFIKSWGPVLPSLLTPIIILLGMFGGIFTPTEAAGVAVIYTALLSIVIYRDITWKDFLIEIKNTAIFCAGIYLIIASASVFSFILTRENISASLLQAVMGSSLPPQVTILLICLVILFLGCFLDGTTVMILVLPIVMPIVKALQFDLIAFGIIVILSAVMGVMTPPFGLGLFIGSKITGLSFGKTTKATVPWLIPIAICIVLMVYFPQIVSVIPNLLPN
ncbi:MAG: TRAP transporter large permease [Sphaerochaetaceae bacterium]|nr:TRAP transporter large permease [Sphaerochaetaceae bacterium]MDX9809418.1 TRAP transporter large permease [Sphaerochaetaceae bacterium]